VTPHVHNFKILNSICRAEHPFSHQMYTWPYDGWSYGERPAGKVLFVHIRFPVTQLPKKFHL
jgi:hypothetical protein